ncbi:polycystin 2L2 [Angomonas deanei]|nr:polycystin 2L2 [Angomonas deanei]|eukprot:EPY23896.1 polycystin 2L2 [Angomonas deanei]
MPSRANSLLSQAVRSMYSDTFNDVGDNRSESGISQSRGSLRSSFHDNSSFGSKAFLRPRLNSSIGPSAKARAKKKKDKHNSDRMSQSGSYLRDNTASILALRKESFKGKPSSSMTSKGTAESTNDISALVRWNSTLNGSTRNESQSQSQPVTSRSTNTPGSSKIKRIKKASRLLQEVPFTFVISRLHQRMASNTNKRDALIFLILVIMFCFATNTDTTVAYAGAQSVSQMFYQKFFPSQEKQMEHFRQRVGEMGLPPWVAVDKTFSEIYHSSEWLDFVQDVILKGLFTFLGPEDRRYNGTNTVPVGAVRFRTIRAAECTNQLQDQIYPKDGDHTEFSRDCWPTLAKGKGELTEDSICPDVRNPLKPEEPLYRYHKCKSYLGSTTKGHVTEYHCGGYSFDIPFSVNQSTLDLFINALRDASCPFVNTWSTRLVLIQFYVYVPSVNAFYQVRYRSEVTSSGWDSNRAEHNYLHAYTIKNSTSFLAYMSVVCLVFVVYMIMVVYNIVSHVRHGGKKTITFFTSPLVYVDVCICASAITFFVLRFMCMAKSITLFSTREFSYPFDVPYPEELERIYYYAAWKKAGGICLLLMSIRITRIFYLAKPLEAVMLTLNMFFSSFCIILVIYAVILVGFALAGWAMFSYSIPAFESIGRSLLTLMLSPFISPTFYPVTNTNSDAFFFYIFCFYTLVGMTIMYFASAVMSVSFTECASKNLLVYDNMWMKRHLRILINKFTARRVKDFFKTLFGFHNENKYLSEICTILQEYLDKQVKADMVGRNQNIAPRISVYSAMRTASTRAAAETAAKSSSSNSRPLLTSFENSGTASHNTAREEEHVSHRRINRDQYKMSYSQWSELLSSRLYKRCGGAEYFADVWRSIIEALRDYEQTPDQISSRENRAQTQDLTRQVMNSELIRIESLDRTISNLEKHITALLDIVQRHEAACDEKGEQDNDTVLVPDIVV